MKKMLSLLLVSLLFFSCNKTTITDIDFRQEMRKFIIEISDYAKEKDKYFIVIPQNGQELITDTGEPDGVLQIDYINSFDATGKESMFYGYNDDDEATPNEESEFFIALCELCEQNGVEVLTTDYCFTQSKMDDSYQQNELLDFISFAAPERNLNVIPDYPTSPYNSNLADITKISEAKNFLYLINPENYATKDVFISDIEATDYDVVLIDLFFNGDLTFTPIDIARMKVKNNGSQRLVICYMSIGEAEDYRYYWQNEWKVGEPVWLEKENPNWKGNYNVRYWEEGWKNLILGDNTAYLDKIINVGFDGVYLDIVDGFEYFEEKYPREEE
ncbi:MAG: endo alpha-1,4 polygalactosaminidase [Bacteroidota bacterium]|nr:endo alpha-1,4 polygalactosaminidase [Bacteroidota bacterium]